jgi:hypothetical protein
MVTIYLLINTEVYLIDWIELYAKILLFSSQNVQIFQKE